jgi:hypothetical protein
MKEDIIAMARRAGAHDDGFEVRFVELRYLERFAALVAAHTLANIDPSKFMSYQEALEAGRLAERDKWMERAHIMILGEREACAKVCDSLEEQCEKLLVPDEKWPTPADCAHIIRARGNT